MLLLIRKIKRTLFANKQFHNYLLYALGEMVLVVIGILIALQINNWNSENQQQEKLHNYLEIVAKNIASDRESIHAVRSERERAYEACIRWTMFSGRDTSFSVPEVNFASRALTMASAMHYFNANTSGYEALKNSGTLDQMAGSDIESLLYEYYDTVNRIALNERDHNEYVRLLWLQVLAKWPAGLEQWEFNIPEVLTVDRFQALQSAYWEILSDTSTKALYATPMSVGTMLIDYEKLDHLGRALQRMVELGVMDFDDSVSSILSGLHDPRSGVGDPNVITDGQASWGSYNIVSSDANDERLSYEASNANRKSPFSLSSMERTGDSLHFDYMGGVEWAGIWFRSDNSIDATEPRDYSIFEKLVLEVKGDVGGETIYVNIQDRDDPRDGTSTKVSLQLSDEWQIYEIDLVDFKTADLEILIIPFGVVFYEEPISFSVRSVKYTKSQ